MHFTLTNPDLIHGPDKLNQLHAELRALAEWLNGLAITRDSAQRTNLNILVLGHDFYEQGGPRVITKIRARTFVRSTESGCFDLDACSLREGSLRQYIFSNDGTSSVLSVLSEPSALMFNSHGEALVDLLEHLEAGLKVLISEMEQKITMLAAWKLGLAQRPIATA